VFHAGLLTNSAVYPQLKKLIPTAKKSMPPFTSRILAATSLHWPVAGQAFVDQFGVVVNRDGHCGIHHNTA
jgi:hypothetical protein